MSDVRLTKKDILQMAPEGITVERLCEVVKELTRTISDAEYACNYAWEARFVHEKIKDLFGEVMGK